MSHTVEAVTTATLGLALDAASLRHQAIATNIANVNTVGYTPLQVNFEAQLEDARRSMIASGKIDPFALAGITVEAMPDNVQQGVMPGVQLDAEVAKMSQNAMHYQALLKGLNSHFSILAMAAGDGKK